jgi:hypothetical protein
MEMYFFVGIVFEEKVVGKATRYRLDGGSGGGGAI